MASVLIVDDTAVDRRLAGGLLESAGEVNVYYAENGHQALDLIRESKPDLVVTDLQMPDLDGLQLVMKINDSYPDLPVILMTAHGSESIAAQALANGAASFVPKTDLAECLVETVGHVLALTQTDNSYKKLLECSVKTDFEFNLVSDPEIIEPLVEMVQQVAVGQGTLNGRTQVQVGLAFENALTNAMFRGNLEIARKEFPVASRTIISQRMNEAPYKDRTVYVQALISPASVRIVVRDQGPGFDTSTVPEASDAESYRDGVGRGLVLIKAFMDEVEFNDAGNEIRMTKFRSQ
jgi:CheY-like chemotaxis protein